MVKEILRVPRLVKNIRGKRTGGCNKAQIQSAPSGKEGGQGNFG